MLESILNKHDKKYWKIPKNNNLKYLVTNKKWNNQYYNQENKKSNIK